ncbi:MAG TPA: hypothetical protein VMY78_05805 [Solirubrobacteraceae bacterium]|nr:hypothetical protein [Solirubrobacteraceae bacterium]
MRDRLTAPLRAVTRELIDKRLWPVAILLLAALVAVPVLIGSSASDAPAPAAVVPAATPAKDAAVESAITVVDRAVIGRSRPGAVNDPFFDPPDPEPTASATTTTSSNSTATTSAPATSTPTSTVSPATSTPPRTTTTPSPATSTPQAPAGTAIERTVFRTRLAFGESDDAPVRGVSRLEALGGDSDPALLVLGTTWGGGYAVFLLGPNAISQGDAECAEATCRVIALKEGDTQTVGVRDDDGTARTYNMKIDEITRQVTSTVAGADRLRAREDADGRDVLRSMILDKATANAIGKFAYDRATGAVVARSDS